jgi:hypothetical protein
MAETQLIRYMSTERRAETQLIRYKGTEKKGKDRYKEILGLNVVRFKIQFSLLLPQWLSSYIRRHFNRNG